MVVSMLSQPETGDSLVLLSASPESRTEEVTSLISGVSLGPGGEQCSLEPRISFIQYRDETQMPLIMRLIQKDLSEPYSIYTYRYFIHNWPNLCFLAMAEGGDCVGAIVCKLDMHKKVTKRGYIAMLAVDSNYRKRKIGSTLVKKAIEAMVEDEGAVTSVGPKVIGSIEETVAVSTGGTQKVNMPFSGKKGQVKASILTSMIRFLSASPAETVMRVARLNASWRQISVSRLPRICSAADMTDQHLYKNIPFQ